MNSHIAGYNNTREKILETLLQRPYGTEIQPENHQEFALMLLEYIRSVELISGSTLIDVAYENTDPVQPDDANVAYIAGVAQARTATFTNFRDVNGEPITISTNDMQAKLAIFTWNRQYWTVREVDTNIVSQAENAWFFYNLTIRKTYPSTIALLEDIQSPVGNDGRYIRVGETVSVHNDSNPREDAIYSYEGTRGWQLQMRLSAIDSRVFDGGRADTKYGGARNVDAGNAQG